MCDEETIMIWCFCLIIASCLTFSSYIFFTDEYTVVKNIECVEMSADKCLKHQMFYRCKIENGETLRICHDAKECSDYCSKVRGK